MPPAKNAVQKLLEEAGKFVTVHNGNWVHSDWEGFLAQAEKLGFPLTDEVKRNAGNILEATKGLFGEMPRSAPKKKAAAKKAAKK